MRTLAACLFLVASGLAPAQTAAPAAGPSRAELKAVERLCDKAIETYGIDSIEQITHARALYIEGYGVVISFEVNLSLVSPLIGFGGGVTQAQKDRIRESKLKRLPEFRQFLEGLLLDSVKSLDHLSPQENLLLNVGFDYAYYEDSDGLPDSISLTAKKKDLLNAAEHNIPRDQLLRIVKVRVE